MNTTKITPAQERIIALMEEGCELSSNFSLVDGKTDYRFALITNPKRTSKRVLITTIDAMLGKGLIAEEKRWILASGTCEGKPHELWTIVYRHVGIEVANVSKKPLEQDLMEMHEQSLQEEYQRQTQH